MSNVSNGILLEKNSRALEVIESVPESFDITQCNFAAFYSFSKRVANGEATAQEISFMNKMFCLIDKRNDWDVAIYVPDE